MSSLGVTAIVAVLVVGRFLVRELRERRYRVDRIYLLPGVLALVSVVLIVLAALGESQILLLLAGGCVAGFLVGGGIGYAVAHFTTVRVTDDPNVLFSRGSYATVAIWVAALGLRLLARLGPTATHHGAQTSLALNAALLVLLTSALFFVRYRLLAAAKRERALGITSALAAM